MKNLFRLALSVIVVIACNPGWSNAQSVPASSDEYFSAFGVRAGIGTILHVGEREIYDAYYDVPFGSVYMCPEVLLYAGSDYSYGFNVKFKKLLTGSESLGLYFDAGIQFMTWEDRAHAGIPIDLSVTVGLGHTLQLEGTVNYTPLFFLGGEPGRGLFSVLAGIRIPVQ